jgi:uncharacterized ParB-like nuclease family protein
LDTLFPEIDVLPISELMLHENESVERTAKLQERIRADGFLRNPVIVAKVRRSSRLHYLLLDGVHRISALKNLGCRDVVAQLIDYSNEAVKVEVWHQLIRGADPLNLLKSLKHFFGKTLIKKPEAEANELRKKDFILMHLLLKNGQSYIVERQSNLQSTTAKIREFVKILASSGELHRVNEDEAKSVMKSSSAAVGILFIQALSKQDIVEIALSETKLPAGITRHIIPCRALGIAADLALLRVELSTAEKSKLIKLVVNQRIEDERVRFYAEPSFVFNE